MPQVVVKPALVPVRRIFISYSREDVKYARELNKIFELLCADLPDDSHIWLDSEEIKGGDEWERKTMQAVEEANVFIVGMSSSYLYSTFARTREFKRIMKLYQQRRARVIGVYLREVGKLDLFAVTLDDGSQLSLPVSQCLPVVVWNVDGVRKLALRPIGDWPSGERDRAWSTLQTQLEKALRDDSTDTNVIVGTAAGTQQEASALISSPIAVPAGLQLAAKALPYLADRDDQELFPPKEYPTLDDRRLQASAGGVERRSPCRLPPQMG